MYEVKGKGMKDIDILVELLCNEQTKMISNDPLSYSFDYYMRLERLKVGLKGEARFHNGNIVIEDKRG